MTPLVLIGIPIGTLLTALFLYRFVGKKEFLYFDAIQFLYAFVVGPTMFVWLKSMLFLILRTEFQQGLRLGDIFFIDTVFSLVALYVFAFIVIHSLTKSFNLRRFEDPLYDLFYHSEYFHLWITHLVMFGGAMLLLTILAVVNAFIPLQIIMPRVTFYSLLAVAAAAGTFWFGAVWLADPKQDVPASRFRFMMLMKLVMGVSFLIHMLAFFIVKPSFNASYILYWFSTVAFAVQVMIGSFMYKSVRAQNIFQRFFEQLKHKGWDFRIQLFKKRT